MGNGFFTVCGVVEIKGKILLVRHTYGSAKDRILVPGGYVEENELPHIAVEREILEETGVVTKAKALISIQFKSKQWCPVFICEYISGTPKSDNYENSEILLLDIDEAINRKDITNMSRELLKIYKANKEKALTKNDYLAKDSTEQNYALFG
ncbi:MAG: NUDIX hydrolase [Clostridia bacterium]|nr:NUDIX hydrolase [Clostridia bacterium]